MLDFGKRHPAFTVSVPPTWSRRCANQTAPTSTSASVAFRYVLDSTGLLPCGCANDPFRIPPISQKASRRSCPSPSSKAQDWRKRNCEIGETETPQSPQGICQIHKPTARSQALSTFASTSQATTQWYERGRATRGAELCSRSVSSSLSAALPRYHLWGIRWRGRVLGGNGGRRSGAGDSLATTCNLFVRQHVGLGRRTHVLGDQSPDSNILTV